MLEHILQDNGDTTACWANTTRSMWRAYFGNCGARSARHPGLQTKFALLQRSVVTGFDYRNTRWPPHRKISSEIDRLQKKMVAGILHIPMSPGESPSDFVKRRGRISSNKCRDLGLWSARHCKRVIAWRDHIQRPANDTAWPARLYQHKGFQWLRERRAERHSSLLAGRTGTRVAPGHVAIRWHDGVRYADSIASSQ